jgi:hypothetical protein
VIEATRNVGDNDDSEMRAILPCGSIFHAGSEDDRLATARNQPSSPRRLPAGFSSRPRRKDSVPRDGGRPVKISLASLGGFADLDRPPPPAVREFCADGGSSRLWKEQGVCCANVAARRCGPRLEASFSGRRRSGGVG